jgi:hypothetical protein
VTANRWLALACLMALTAAACTVLIARWAFWPPMLAAIVFGYLSMRARADPGE